MTKLPLLPVEDENTQFNFDRISIALPDFGGVTPNMRWGAATASIPGGTADTDTTTVAHGLGKIPSQVIINSVYDGTGVYAGALRLDGANAPDATNFKFFGRDVAGTAHAAGSVVFYWVALG